MRVEKSNNVVKDLSLTLCFPLISTQLDAEANKEWLGGIVAANPLGQLIFSPLIGWWCNRVNSIGIPSLFCLVLFILSNAWYAVLPLHRINAKYYMFAARFLIGVSSGRYLLTYLIHSNHPFQLILLHIHKNIPHPSCLLKLFSLVSNGSTFYVAGKRLIFPGNLLHFNGIPKKNLLSRSNPILSHISSV